MDFDWLFNKLRTQDHSSYQGTLMDLSVFSFHEWQPLAFLGFISPFWTLNMDTIICTWIAMLAIFITCKVLIHSIQKNPTGMPSFIITYSTRALINMAAETLGTFDAQCFTVAMSLFLFSFFCTLVSLIPQVEEATRDINTTLALSLTSFVFVQYQGFKAHGISHLREYAQPFIFMLPMHIVGDLAKIISMSFRLFGNILAGSVILQLMFLVLTEFSSIIRIYILVIGILLIIAHALTLLNPNYVFLKKHIPKLYAIFFIPAGLQFFFGLFEGLIQSGIIALLTLTYAGLTINNESSQS